VGGARHDAEILGITPTTIQQLPDVTQPAEPCAWPAASSAKARTDRRRTTTPIARDLLHHRRRFKKENRYDPGKENPMNLALWIVTGLLVVLMLNAATKLFLAKEKLAPEYGKEWMADNSVGFVKSIGALEFLAAVGLILPAALDIAPVLVPLAAVGLGLLMVGAAIVHLRRHQVVPAVLNVTFLAIAAFVAWGRFGPESFTG
jgi:hypothetical protein